MSLGAEEQLELLRRGVDAITPEAEFVAKLNRSVATGTPLRVKYGIDPTGIDVHLGHTVPLRKLRQFQDLGHTAVVIIGNYSALVGDPSGGDAARVSLPPEQVEANARDYLTQVGKLVDLRRAEVHFNGEWFSKWSFLDVLNLTRKMTLGQISARDDFSKRIAASKPVYLHECLYPLMQGWDSVEIRSDVELGGTEQLFSLLVARDLQHGEGQPGQVAMTMPILVGTDGERKMGKSLSNYIGVAEAPDDQFGKIMSLPDAPMREYFTLLTDFPLLEVDRLLGPGVNPRDAKEVLGKSVVTQYHGEDAAVSAAEGFRKQARREDPDEIPEVELLVGQLTVSASPPKTHLAHLLMYIGFESSLSSARRMIEQGGVSIGPNREVIRDPKYVVDLEKGLIVRDGKRKIKFVRYHYTRLDDLTEPSR